MPTTDHEYVSSPQAAAALGVSRRTVHRMVATGHLTPALIGPGGPHGAFLFRAADVQALAARSAA